LERESNGGKGLQGSAEVRVVHRVSGLREINSNKNRQAEYNQIRNEAMKKSRKEEIQEPKEQLPCKGYRQGKTTGAKWPKQPVKIMLTTNHPQRRRH